MLLNVFRMVCWYMLIDKLWLVFKMIWRRIERPVQSVISAYRCVTYGVFALQHPWSWNRWRFVAVWQIARHSTGGLAVPRRHIGRYVGVFRSCPSNERPLRLVSRGNWRRRWSAIWEESTSKRLPADGRSRPTVRRQQSSIPDGVWKQWQRYRSFIGASNK